MLTLPANIATLETRVAAGYADWFMRTWCNTRLDTVLPHFVAGYVEVRNRLHYTELDRSQMPVLETADMAAIKAALPHPSLERKLHAVEAHTLYPFQKEIYLDKVLDPWKTNTPQDILRFAKGQVIYVSEDNYVMDGHHRWVQAYIHSGRTKMQACRLMLPAHKLLPILMDITVKAGRGVNA